MSSIEDARIASNTFEDARIASNTFEDARIASTNKIQVSLIGFDC